MRAASQRVSPEERCVPSCRPPHSRRACPLHANPENPPNVAAFTNLHEHLRSHSLTKTMSAAGSFWPNFRSPRLMASPTVRRTMIAGASVTSSIRWMRCTASTAAGRACVLFPRATRHADRPRDYFARGRIRYTKCHKRPKRSTHVFRKQFSRSPRFFAQSECH